MLVQCRTQLYKINIFSPVYLGLSNLQYTDHIWRISGLVLLKYKKATSSRRILSLSLLSSALNDLLPAEILRSLPVESYQEYTPKVGNTTLNLI